MNPHYEVTERGGTTDKVIHRAGTLIEARRFMAQADKCAPFFLRRIYRVCGDDRQLVCTNKDQERKTA